MSNYKYEGYGVIRDLKSDIPYHTDDIVDLLEGKDIHIKKLKEEITQLKQSQKQLAIKELEELQKEFDYCPYSGDSICVAEVYDKIFAKIQELGGGENVKN